MERIKYVLLLSGYIKNYRWNLIWSILIHGSYKSMPIALGFETSYVLMKSLNGTLADPKIHFLTVFLMIIVTAILNYLDIFVAHDVAYRILTELRNLCYDKISEIAPAGLQQEKSGNIMSVVLEDVEILEWFYAHSVIEIFVAILLPLISLFVLGMFSVWISLVILFFIILMCAIPFVTREYSDLQGKKVQEELGELNSVIVDGIQGLKDIVTFQWQKNYFGRLYWRNDRYNKELFEYSRQSSKEVSTINLIVGISSILSATMIAYFAATGAFSYEWILPLISLSMMIYNPLQETLATTSNYGRIFASAKRVFYLQQLVSSVPNNGKYSCVEIMDQSENTVTFEGVSFSYFDKETQTKNEVLKNISFVAKMNETVVLVGKSGCGKSTCIKLLQRFWDVDRGKILINKTDIRDIDLRDLRELITVVPQDVYLFNKSIEGNLKLANDNAGEKEMKEALKNANADGFINEFKDGMDTFVGEKGLRLSGGEKQRISIAQAFLKKSPILVLDEITANLDYNNEKLINEALSRLKKGKVTLMIAHRLSTIKGADKIVFIKDGNSVEIGNYEELIKRNEDFRNTVGIRA